MNINIKTEECTKRQAHGGKSDGAKVLLLTNLVTSNLAQHGQESQQALTIYSSGKVTLTRYFWVTEKRIKKKNVQIASSEAENIINMIEQTINDNKPTCYLLDRGTVVMTVTRNGRTKHCRVYLNSEIKVDDIDINGYIKNILNLPEAVVLGEGSADYSCLE